ncbi:Fe-S cluster assembly protein IscX [Haliscomenobacter sp.]|uniref:Fe-S cluster assembly protein IscX n=1 Tax=Haliscomenobacter sp. TaxID=2717303 RepID=UPI00336527EA
MAFDHIDNLPITWTDHEDVAMRLFERFGGEFTEGRIYRIRFTELIDWVLELPGFVGTREECSENNLEQIQAKWVYEWRDNQK